MAKRSKHSQRNQPPRNKADQIPAVATSDGPSAWIVAALLAISLGALYAPALDVPFIFDDVISIVKNESIVSLWPLVGTSKKRGPLNPVQDLPTSGRPLVNYSFALNYRFGGINPVGYHAVNALIHFGSAMLLWAITRRTLRLPYYGARFAASASWLALAVALLWALHPIQTEAVIYATQRTELMMAFCYLATLYFSMRYWDSHAVVWLSLAILACFAGMASKEVMVSAPLIVLLFERTFIAGSIANAVRRTWPLYVGLASSWILLLVLNIGSPRSGSAGFAMGVTAYSWWLTQAKVLLMYLKLVVWPTPLLLHYELPYLTSLAEAWMYVVPVLLLGLITLVLLWRNRPLGFLGTWLFAILSPTLVVPIVTEMAAERRMYLPLVALVALVIVGGYRLARSVTIPSLCALGSRLGIEAPLVTMALPVLCLAVAWSFISVKQLNEYHNELGLWEEVMRWQPQNHMAHQNIGSIMYRAGNLTAALEHCREAVRLNPNSHLAHYGLGVVLAKMGSDKEAVAHFAEAARTKPTDIPTWINLAASLLIAERHDESIAASRAALDLDPDHWAAHNNLGLALQKRGDYQEALQALQRALRLNPQALDLYNDIADTYFLAKQPAEATATLEAGLEKARSSGDAALSEKFSARLNEKREQ